MLRRLRRGHGQGYCHGHGQGHGLGHGHRCGIGLGHDHRLCSGLCRCHGRRSGGSDLEVGGAERMGGETEAASVSRGTELDSLAVLALRGHPAHVAAVPVLLRRDVRDEKVRHSLGVPADRTPRTPAPHPKHPITLSADASHCRHPRHPHA
eukprot:767159-Rhodomonas_salina.2